MVANNLRDLLVVAAACWFRVSGDDQLSYKTHQRVFTVKITLQRGPSEPRQNPVGNPHDVEGHE